MGRNVLRGTSQSNVDCSLVKRFPIRESRTVEFRSDFVNLFNQANRNNPIRDISGVTATGGSVFLSGQLRAASWLEFQLETGPVPPSVEQPASHGLQSVHHAPNARPVETPEEKLNIG